MGEEVAPTDATGSCGRRVFLVLSACAMLSIETLVRAATDTGRPLLLGTSTPGGGFALYGEVLERVLNAHAGRTLLRAKPTRGTTENLDLLRRGELDAALIQGTAASELFQPGAAGDLRILFAMYPSPGMLAVPAASAVRRLEDLLGRPVVFGVRTSGLVTLGRQVFSGIGIDIDSDLQAIYVDEAAASPRIVLAGRADGLWGAGEGWPGFTRLAQAPGGARFIGPSPGQIPLIVAKYPLLKAMDVAVDAYPGIDRPLATVGSVNLIVTRADLDDARATAFVEAMRAASSQLAAALPQAAFSTLANTLASAPDPAALHRVLHPAN
jgi:TRAP transporter TAXI family solute receptor